MPKPKYILSAFHKNNLYWKLVDAVCFPIRTKADCRKISDLITFKSLPPVSESTLYRLLLSEKSDNTPYLHTLDILALFCGFANWSKLELHFNTISRFEQGYGKLNDFRSDKKSLLKICIHRNDLKPLYEFSEQFDSSLDFEKKLNLGFEFYHSLKSNPNKNLLFYKNFSHLPIIRESLYEIFADPDFQVKDYELGIQYYLKGVKPGKSITSLQDFIFGNCLLLRHYYATNQKQNAIKIAKLLYEDYAFSIREIEKIYIFPRIRYLTYKLFYYDINNLNTKVKKHEEWLNDYASNNINNIELLEKRIMFYTIADAFSILKDSSIEQHQRLKKIFDELLHYIPNIISKKSLKEIIPFVEQNASLRRSW